jgi:uncharacterized protein (DUF2267 family)
MSDPVTRNFNASLQKTYEWLGDVESALPFGDRQTAYHALRSVLHTLRDRLTAEEACDLAAELPSVLRGIYFEGWSPAHKPVKMNALEFTDQIETLLEPLLEPGADGLETESCISAVFGVLEKHISPGEISDIRGALPREFQDFWSG